MFVRLWAAAAQVQRDFRRPEGVAEGDMDAAAGGFVTGMPAVIEVSADAAEEDRKER